MSLGKPKTPRDLVKNVVVTDQHGRRWSVLVEKETYDAAGPYSPVGWSAPWLPPQKPGYFVLDRDQPHLVQIHYERITADQQVAESEYEGQLRKLGVALHGHAYDPEAPPTKNVMDVLGDRPWSWQVAEAARRGDRWILGQSEKVNEKLAALIPAKRRRLDDVSDFDESLLGEVDERPKGKKQLAGAGV